MPLFTLPVDLGLGLRVLDPSRTGEGQGSDGFRDPPAEIRVQLLTFRYPKWAFLHGAPDGCRPAGPGLGILHAIPGRHRSLEHRQGLHPGGARG